MCIIIYRYNYIILYNNSIFAILDYIYTAICIDIFLIKNLLNLIIIKILLILLQ